MALAWSATIRGGPSLEEALRRLRLPGARRIYARSLRRAGVRVRDRARRAYLSGSPLRRRSGRLYRSVTVDDRELAKRLDGRGVLVRVVVGTPLPQGAPLHFGWPAKNIRARPWLFPAVEDERRGFPKIWVEEIDAALPPSDRPGPL